MGQPRDVVDSAIVDIAGAASAAPNLPAFRRQVLDHLGRLFATDAGAMCSTRDGRTIEASDLRGEADILVADIPRWFAQLTAPEFQAARQPRTQLDVDILGARRRDRLAMYQEYLYPRDIRQLAVRMWTGRRAEHWFAVSLETRQPRLVSRAIAMLDRLYPVIALGEELHESSGPDDASRIGRWCSFHGLSRTETDVVSAAVRGLRNGEIARLRGVSPHTVRNRLASAFRKLEVTSRSELVYLALTEDPFGRLDQSIFVSLRGHGQEQRLLVEAEAEHRQPVAGLPPLVGGRDLHPKLAPQMRARPEQSRADGRAGNAQTRGDLRIGKALRV
jgi:DNA-binding CsgD family transcriptional regulator